MAAVLTTVSVTNGVGVQFRVGRVVANGEEVAKVRERVGTQELGEASGPRRWRERLTFIFGRSCELREKSKAGRVGRLEVD